MICYFIQLFTFPKKNLKLSYEDCLTELRKQAVSIQRLEDVSETQARARKGLQEVISRQATAIGKMEFILSQAGQFLEKPSSVDDGRLLSLKFCNMECNVPKSFNTSSSQRSFKYYC